jgi:hypothetical protein
MSIIPRVNRTLYGRLFGIVPGYFRDNNCSNYHEYIEPFNLGNNWFGKIIHRYRYKSYYGNAKNNVYYKYSNICIDHNIMSLTFSEEILLVSNEPNFESTIDNIKNYKLSRTRFTATSITQNIEWCNLPSALIYNINKKNR